MSSASKLREKNNVIPPIQHRLGLLGAPGSLERRMLGDGPRRGSRQGSEAENPQADRVGDTVGADPSTRLSFLDATPKSCS